jgi:hypothetical protein
MSEQEIKLQVGQANEALEKLRLALGQKTLIYRLVVQESKTQSTKTRAKSEIDQINRVIQGHIGSYRQARQALINLEASKKILENFKALEDKDVKVNTDVVEENRVGQRNDVLAWFWRMEGGPASKGDNWMEESK